MIQTNKKEGRVYLYKKQWANKKLFKNYRLDGIVVKINSTKLQLIR